MYFCNRINIIRFRISLTTGVFVSSDECFLLAQSNNTAVDPLCFIVASS